MMSSWSQVILRRTVINRLTPYQPIQFGFISSSSITSLSNKLSTTEAYVRGVISFYSFLHASPREDFDIYISDSITDDPRILSCTLLSVRFLGSIAPTRKARIVILPKAFAVKQVSLKNVQSKV